jgi:hypothetical protein
MKKNGIDFVSQVIKTAGGEPYLFFNKGVLAVFKFVNGVHAEDKPVTFVPYMVKIYNLPEPDFFVEREDFSTNSFPYLERQARQLKDDKEISDIINANWDLLNEVDQKLKTLVKICENKQKKLVITSGDIGGNSLVVDGKINIIDWDWIKLAPPERDFWWYVQDLNQITEINAAFRRESFDYSLDNDFLGYYACFSFIFFLMEILDSFLFNPVSRPEVMKRLIDYFDKDNHMIKSVNNISL